MRMLLPLAIVLLLGACAGLTGSDPALYQSLADSDVQLASRTMQSTLERRAGWRDAVVGERPDRPPGVAHADPHLCQRQRLFLPRVPRGAGGRGTERHASITPPAVTRTPAGYGSEGTADGTPD